ncbi:stalk domain-containing protein [Caldalkalibacillus mannanilyticus]|uniref:stalk domain-containing protein n=1 Tax=Caldalkalibacillus mannanilyticus TaxID=1418 RepID=UPI00046A1EA2|nr:stalk domain-containing protein [Caldalkalibacillus mannanilyticus]
MFKNVKAGLIGMVIGGMLVSGVGYASTYLTKIEVSLEPVQFSYNQKLVATSDKQGQIFNGKEYVPASFIYQGTTYVPVRFVGEAVDKNVEWNNKTKTIEISDKAQAPVAKPTTPSQSTSTAKYEVIWTSDYGVPEREDQNNPLPAKVKEWVGANYQKNYNGHMTENGATYILLSRGESSSSGHGIEVDDLTLQGSKATVKGKYTDPKPEEMYLTVITYPTVLIKVDQELSDVTFDISKNKASTPKEELK